MYIEQILTILMLSRVTPLPCVIHVLPHYSVRPSHTADCEKKNAKRITNGVFKHKDLDFAM